MAINSRFVIVMIAFTLLAPLLVDSAEAYTQGPRKKCDWVCKGLDFFYGSKVTYGTSGESFVDNESAPIHTEEERGFFLAAVIITAVLTLSVITCFLCHCSYVSGRHIQPKIFNKVNCFRMAYFLLAVLVLLAVIFTVVLLTTNKGFPVGPRECSWFNKRIDLFLGHRDKYESKIKDGYRICSGVQYESRQRGMYTFLEIFVLIVMMVVITKCNYAYFAFREKRTLSLLSESEHNLSTILTPPQQPLLKSYSCHF